jgi:predicted transposase YbfD/YdcC
MNIKTFMEYFDKVKDPRKGNAKKHALSDILVLTCLGIICGAETWIEIEDFGRLHKGWLKNILDLKHGIPSHDTLARVIARINPKAFQDILIHLTRDMAKEMEEQFIAIDGKTLRRSHDNRNHQSALHLVSAWATHNHLTLGQISTDKKKNEIKAIDKLLDVLDIKRCTVTIDAMGCQKALAKKIIDKGGHYLFTVKANQGKLHQCLIKLFNDAKDHETFDGKRMVFSEKQSIDGDHGRIEERYYAVIPSMYSCIQQKNWPELKSFIQSVLVLI